MVHPASLLTLLVLLIASVLSAPIHISSTGSNAVHVDSRYASLEKHSPLFSKHLEHGDKRARPKRGDPKPDLTNPNELESRSFERIAEESLEKRAVSQSTPALDRRGLWSKLKKGVSNGFKKAAGAVRKAAHTVRKTVHRATSGIKKVAHRVVHAAKKAVHWVKQNGAKIAKVGLKSMAALSKAASHVAAVIPGVGKPIGLALSNFSKTADFAQQQIHVSLGSKLDKVMKVMDRIQHPLGTGAAGKILDAVLKRDTEEGQNFYKRDLLDEGELYERDVDGPFDIQRAARSLRYLKDA